MQFAIKVVLGFVRALAPRLHMHVVVAMPLPGLERVAEYHDALSTSVLDGHVMEFNRTGAGSDDR